MKYAWGEFDDSNLTESQKIQQGIYPRYDKDTLTRKIRAVTGSGVKSKEVKTITPEEWVKIMAMCRKEYEWRNVHLIPETFFRRIEAKCLSRSQQSTYQRRLRELIAILEGGENMKHFNDPEDADGDTESTATEE